SKELEKQLKYKGRRAVIDSSDDEKPSLDVEDSPKQGKMIAKIDKDENVDLVKSNEQREAHTIAEHIMESEFTKDKRKGIMQEPELPKKIKEKERIQLSLDEELAQKLYAKELAKETTRQEQENSKKQKLDEQAEVQVDSDQEEVEMKKYIKIVLGEEIAIDAIPLATKPLVIIDWKIISEGWISSYHIIRANGSSKRYT
nr:hypothetical protein [Tanacetum cinerariifolium]GFA70242.1 hypothetical protein [Tanacetum cinerariifolium]